MKSATDQLLDNLSIRSINDFFRRQISAFKIESEDLQDVVPEQGYDRFTELQKHGEVSYDDGDELLVFSCKYRGELTARSSKKKQYEIAKKALKEDFKDGALFLFYDDAGRFRFSFIRRNYGDQDAKYTPWKRYTYLVDPAKQNKTFKRRIDQCTFSSLDEIQEAFSVEPLSKQFYKELSNWYFAALREVKFPNEKGENEYVVHANAMIRLITRLMFVWFMKQKGLVPDDLFDREKLDDLLKYDDVNDSTYYKAILQNLFFATLNTPRIDKNGSKRIFVTRQYGIPNFFRYRRFLKDEQQFLDLMDKVPFLNGGLFENLDIVNPDEGIDIRIDCFSENKKNEPKLKVPDRLFFGEWEADISDYLEGDGHVVPVTGIIDILNRYDFTIDENTPTDQEVALDPELLGLVFENLLASYNPETQSTARKESGSFYTPRPIVDYMVVESLSHYLENVTELPKDDIKHLFLDDDKQPIGTEAERIKIIDAISELKIIDPACGSGAFPMGTLQKMVYALAKLDPDNSLWRASQERRIKKQLAEKMDEMTLDEIKAKLDRDFNTQLNDPDYARKLYLIENCLYGVDIQPIAMQISKLRFFISLLVEQKLADDVNYGIIPLPNLETKFVAANTLIKLNKPVSGKKGQVGMGFLKNLNLEKLEDQLEEYRHSYFTARTPKTKKKYRDLIKEVRSEMTDILINDGWDNDEAQKISQWEPFDQNGKSKWFDPKWMFGLDHFDIVIGNPPYIQLQKALPGHEDMKYADVYKEQKYKTFERTGDIYALFYERGMDILGPSGMLCYITSNKWMRAKYGKSLRKYCSELRPVQLIDLGPGVFDSATVDVNILLIENSPKGDEPMLSLTLRDKEKINHLSISDFTPMDQLGEDSWIILSPEELAIKQKIERIGKPLKDWDIKINRGVLTGYNEAFIISGELKDKLIAEDPKSAEILKPILRGRDIKRYKAEYSDLWLIASHNGYKKDDGTVVPRINIEDYPAIKRWLDSHWDRLEKRADQGATPYNLRNCAYWEDFEKEKIIYPEMTKYLNFVFDDTGYATNNKNFILSGSNIKFLITIFNSALFHYLLRMKYPELQGGTRELRKVFFEQEAVIQPLPSFIKKCEDLLEIILDKKTSGSDSKNEEQQIDLLVYKLYELTYEEVLIVDPGTELGREEYEGYTVGIAD